ncbi:glycosyltransferase [candidate division CSSED10-310 bacterium]|uniref:Glycosyltransferase n=1 Tax=candidate division CSSED10-310 bacterium TaxID=2855610 RepID=A0ABV6Z1M0_UNCC1
MNNKIRKKELYDEQARLGFPWKKRNWVYHRNLYSLIGTLVPPDRSVLEIGCGNGDLLHHLNPRRAVGIDISPLSIERAKELYPDYEFQVMDAEDLQFSEKFDVIILSDLVGELSDVWRVLDELHKVTAPHSRIIITYFNYLWAPFLKIAEKLGFKMPQDYQNWLSLTDLTNFLALTDFEVIRKGWRFLIPMRIPGLSWFINRYLAFLPGLRKLCLSQYLVARTMPRKQKSDSDKYSCSVLIPTRNEKGNVQDAVERVPQMGSHTEIIFVDGASTDGTVAEIEKMIEEWQSKKDIKLIHQIPPDQIPSSVKKSGRMLTLGKGDAVRKGFDAAQGDILMILDADLTVPPEELPKFFKLATERAGELIIGTRLVYPMEKQAMRFLNVFGNKFFSYLFTWLLDQPIKDTLCGTKVLRKSDYELIKKGRSYFGDFDPFGDFDLIFGAAKLNLKIIELPIRYRQRLYGDIKIERFKHGLILLRMCAIAFNKFKLMDNTP